MLAIVRDDELRLARDYPQPVPGPGEALIQVRLAGVCATDLEVVRGYRQFRGVLGHEFVGRVMACSEPDASDEEGGWIGQRVVGEINIVCGACSFCRRGLPTHCTSRVAMGIAGHEGAFAEFVTLPLENLHPVPPDLPDEAAVFTEPLAAALQTLSLVHVRPGDRVAVIGDGKLGLLTAQVLATTGAEVTVVGRHPEKLALAAGWGLNTGRPDGLLDMVVECSGNPSGLAAALELVRPRGSIVLKSTYHGLAEVDLSRVVVDEIRLIGSRCGPFRAALGLLQSGRVEVTSLIEASYALADGLAALQHAGRRGALKVLIRP
jgi:threonine dehydrogenase-like Zn-dependent dehydrogenase